MELHEHGPAPITLAIIKPRELDAFREELAGSNPHMRHATIGQLAVSYANQIFQNVEVSPFAWTYNASTEEYARA
jgi:hypothetical protein